jgi:uncharacterized OsmC-like protein
MSNIHVRATYLEREQILIETSQSTFVADHPVNLGGDGRGPSAGELVLMALDASTVLHIAANAATRGIDVPSVVSRSAYQHARIANDGPLSTIMYMAEVAQSIEVGGDVSDAELTVLAELAADTPIVRSLTDGIELTEEVVVNRTTGARQLNPFVNEIGRDYVADAEREVSAGIAISAAEPRWRISATSIGDGLALVNHSHQPYLAAATALNERGPSPAELLVAALASCTAFYIIHNTGFDAIPFDQVVVEADAVVSDDGRVISVVRKAFVTGPVSEDEANKIEYFANHCYIGESFRRRPHFTRDVIRSRSGATPIEALYAAALTTPSDGIGCDDGSCCIPEFADRAAAATV